MNNGKISVVIPCYYAEKSIAEVVEKTAEELDKYGDYEFVLVNDGSDDGTYFEIKKLAEKYSFVIGVDLSKNCGQHNAILAGMKYAGGDYILGMDDDFQTNPSQIGKLIDKLNEGYDIVYGRFPKRHHGFFRNLMSALSHISVCYLLDKPKDLKACPMYMIRRFVRDEIIKSQSSFTNLQGLFLRTTSKIANAEIEHFDRRFGKSGYNLKKLFHLWESLLNYSLKPIRLIVKAGVLIFLIGLVYLLLAYALGSGFEHKIDAEIGIFSGLILSAVGIVGEYVVRMFMAVTKEPQYIIRQDTLTGDEAHEKEIADIGCR